ncbi:RNA polymerase sigma factor [Kitasatospora putterlickiae]|uniref:RNA polymerase sigma factor n=1 Tax=Kitasatospora putterlickiae TaxID=221725 RepID=A0ABP4ITS7_9ACTN
MGEEDEFRAVYGAHHTAVYRYVRRRVAPGDAADVTAEVFTTVWRRFGDRPRSTVLPWLYGVARKTVANHLRARESALAAVRAGESVTVATARDVGEQVAARDAVHRAWSGLSPADREVLALIGWEGLPVRDAARALGCGTAVFSMRLLRARKRLRMALDALEADSSLPEATDTRKVEVER